MDNKKTGRKIKNPVTKGVAKVPVVMQLEALECGAASLTMVLAYYNKWIPLEQVRYDCDVSRDGSNARNILIAARNYGLEAQGFKMEPSVLFEDGQFPCIVHWEFNHFIVCNGVKGNKVYVNDPARGNVVMTREQFDEGFTGIVLMFEPTESFEPSGKRKSVMDFAKKRMQGTGIAVAFVCITTVILSIVNILNAGYARMFIELVLDGHDRMLLIMLLFFMSAMAAVQIVTVWIQQIYNLRINGKLAVVGSTAYMWKVLRLPMVFFSQRMAGDIQMRRDDNEQIASSLVNVFAPLVLDSAMMIFYLVVMLRYSVILSVIGIASIVIKYLVGQIISKKRVNITRVLMRDEGKLSGLTVAGIDMIETIKASGAENGFFEKWSGYHASVNAGTVRYMHMDHYLGIIPEIVSELTNIAILTGGVALILKGQFTLGSVMAFQGMLTSFVAPAGNLISSGQTIQEMRTQMERIEDVMEYPEDDTFKEHELTEQENYAKLRGRLELKNITFGYSRLSPPLIEDFSMTLEPGAKVAFVGPSGCGKSTLAKLISGLYKPWSGEILFDGKPIEEIDKNVFKGSLAVVDQDITLFEDTVSENIKMWDSTIEDFEVIMAARDAQIHEDIVQREGGYNHKLIEGGNDFSGGQRQRMEIARVLSQDPTVIIMDEATSALDAKTEYNVINSIKDRGISCIVVAHRLSTIRDCEEIIVLDKGKVVERGTHAQLYANGGKYTELVASE